MRALIWVGVLAGFLAGCLEGRDAYDAGEGPGGGPPEQRADGGTPDAGDDAGTRLDAGTDAGTPDAGTDGGVDAGTPDAGPAADVAKPCPDLFAQDLLPTYRLEITPAEWAKLEDEFLNWEARAAQGLERHPWHPLVFRYGDEVISDARIRLKGDSSWRLTVQNDPNPKMQFVISFNEVNSKHRFHGVRKLVLDMPRNDRTFLRQRMALWTFRKLGVPALCANNARLEINGEYYGLFTNMEKMDKEFVQRVFPTADEGDLWEFGEDLKTNEETSTHERQHALFAATNAAGVAKLADVRQALEVWALDAVLPNSDGYFAGTENFMLYDHPERGFLWIPYDLDGTFFDFAPYDADPVSYLFAPQKRLHWRLVMSDPTWRAEYLRALERAIDGYDVKALEANVDAWAKQIHAAAAADPRRPFTLEQHESHVGRLRTFFAQRKTFLKGWLSNCKQQGPASCPSDGSAP